MHQSLLDFKSALWNTEYMEEAVQPANPQPVIPQTPPTHRHIISLVVVAVIVAILASLGTYLFMSSQQNKQSQMSNQQPQQSSQVTQAPTEIPVQPTEVVDAISAWNTHTNIEGKYSFQYPQGWVIQDYKKDIEPGNTYFKGYILFQSRAQTAKEKADDAPGLPADMGTGSIEITTGEKMRGVEYAKISEKDFFNPQNNFWMKGTASDGTRTNYSTPQEVTVGGKRAIKQTSHPTTNYEWFSPNQITINYYVWLGNVNNEIAKITFTYDENNPNKTVLLQDFNKMISSFKLLP